MGFDVFVSFYLFILIFVFRLCGLLIVTKLGLESVSVLQGFNQKPKNKVPVVGTASLNLAEFASAVDQKGSDLSIPLTLPGGSSSSSVDPSPSLTVCPNLHPEFHFTHCSILYHDIIGWFI